MINELQKQNELRAARDRDRREKAQNTLKKYSPEERGAMRNNITNALGKSGNDMKPAMEKMQGAKDAMGRNKNKNAALQMKQAANLAKNATPWGMLSLLGEFKLFADWMYGLALFAAIFKDLLDLIEATGVLYVVVIVATFCVSIFIAMMMILGSSSNGGHGRKQQKMIRSYLILLGGTTVEIVFGLNFLPVETLTVLIIYALLLSDRKQNKQSETYA